MNIEALKQLDRVLAEVEAKGLPFDINNWGEPDCRTTACAIGWAMRDPWFREHGLFPKASGTPFFNGEVSFSALSDFFQIELEVSHSLFWPEAYSIADETDISAVRRRIALLLAGKEIPTG